MKKYITLLLLVLLIPIKSFAATYTMTGTDVTMDFNEDWIVLTRDNYNDEELLSSLNLTYDYMNSVFMDNDAYMDAFKYWDSSKSSYVEMFIIMTPDALLNNLNTMEDQDIIDQLKTVPEYASANTLEIYKNDNSKFAYTEYNSSGLYLCNFFTIINGKTYVFKFQSSVELDDAKKAVIKDVMSTAKFDYELDNGGNGESGNPGEQNDIAPKENKKSGNSIAMKALIGGLIGAAAGAVCGVVVFLIKKGMKKDTDSSGSEHYNPYGNENSNSNDDDDKPNKFINL